MLFKVDKHMFYYLKKEDSNYMGCTDVHIQFVVLHLSEYFQIKIKWGWGGGGRLKQGDNLNPRLFKYIQMIYQIYLIKVANQKPS